MKKEAFCKHLEKTVFFLQVQGANPFKIRALEKAPHALEALSEQEFLDRVKDAALSELPGIGKGLSAMAAEFVENESTNEYEAAREGLPESLLELDRLKGLGPKKIKALYEGLQIASLGELEYACYENRLVSLKGFGEKTQQQILENIKDIKSRRGKQLLPEAIEKAEKLTAKFQKQHEIQVVGDLGAKREIVSSLDFVIRLKNQKASKEDPFIERLISERKKSESRLQPVEMTNAEGFRLRFYMTKSRHEFVVLSIFLTSSETHWKSLRKAAQKKKASLSELELQWSSKKSTPSIETEEDVYKFLDLPFYPPEAREFEARSKIELVEENMLTGVFHAHTTFSDGANSLEEMALAAQKHGWAYFGISEHSQSSFYAKGLKENELKEQWKEIEKLNASYKDFRIFKGIESDILKDGTLDYPEKILKKFDFVIASIHQRYGMKEMTERTLTALNNPYCTMLGHWSGRLLLSRPAYQLDKQKVIRRAIEKQVAIELNSHPQRLDMDWRDIFEACRAGLVISINPDAHSVYGFDDVKYGVWMARKALVKPQQILNTWSPERVEKFLCQRKSA